MSIMPFDESLYLQAKNVAFNALFDLLPINFSWMDRQGYVLGCNRRVLESLHLHNFEDIIGKHTVEIASELAWEIQKKWSKQGNHFQQKKCIRMKMAQKFISLV